MSKSLLSLYLTVDTPETPILRHIDSLLTAGFPSPAGDYLEDRIDLNHELVRNPASTFLARVRGESMRDAGLQDGDLILIDRSVIPRSGSMVLAWIDGGFTVKHLHLYKGKACLKAANPDYPDLELNEEEDNRIWGVVSYIIHRQTP